MTADIQPPGTRILIARSQSYGPNQGGVSTGLALQSTHVLPQSRSALARSRNPGSRAKGRCGPSLVTVGAVVASQKDSVVAKNWDPTTLESEIVRLQSLGIADLRREWTRLFKAAAPPALTKNLLAGMIAYRLQEQVFGGLDKETRNLLDRLAHSKKPKDLPQRLKPGTVLVRDYQGTRHEVMIIREGFAWQGATYGSLSAIAGRITGTTWNGRRFFGIDRLAAPFVDAERKSATPITARKGIAASVKVRDDDGVTTRAAGL